MSSFNKVLLMGNLTRDPQVKHLPSNVIVAEFGLATSRRYRSAAGEDRDETTFVDCTAFGRQAEVISQFCRKGKPVFIEGRLKYDSWEDKQTGGRRSKLTVVVENFQFVGGRDGAAGAGSPGADMFGSDRPWNSAAPASGQSAPGETAATDAPSRKRRAKTADLPFGPEKQFQEADIPF
jgi:single-strand DNA-binding protein